MKFDLNKFKKISSSDKSTVLAHPDGHTITIAHNSLSPKMKSQLQALPEHKAGGGEIEKPKASAQQASQQLEQQTAPIIDEVAKKREPKKFADGGEAESQDAPPAQPPVVINVGGPSGAPAGVSQMTDQMSQAPPQDLRMAPPQPVAPPIDPNVAAIPQTKVASPQGEVVEPQQVAELPPSSAARTLASDASGKGPSTPDLEHGYNLQQQGIQAQAAAQGQQGQAESAALQKNIADQQQAQQDYQGHVKQLTDEYHNFVADVQNQHIDPQHYLNSMGTGQKISTAIGLILGGIGGGITHQENPAMKFINSQIDNDIAAQRLNLGKSENLLSANLKQFGNIRDAADMTKAMQLGIVASQLKEAAAKAATPMAKAAAMQASGQLEQQVAPLMLQLGMRRTLMGGAASGQQDPSSFVQFVVPKEHQKEVFGEIERAQDTRRMGDSIMQSFDAAAKDARPMSGGALKNVLPGVTSPHVLAFHQAMQPTFKDLEGTVRQAAMDNTFYNLTPRLGDSDATVAIKRKATEDYLNSKKAAPTAKGFGIDLDKFQSTSSDPETRLSPEHSKFLKFARENPNDPRSALILKKLRIGQ